MNYKHIKDLKRRCNKELFESILLAVDQYLKFNKLSFNKYLTNEEFFRIIKITEGMFRRAGVGESSYYKF